MRMIINTIKLPFVGFGVVLQKLGHCVFLQKPGATKVFANIKA